MPMTPISSKNQTLTIDELLAHSKTLPSEWRKWVIDNLNRGCHLSGILQTLKENALLPKPVPTAHRPDITTDDDNFISINGHSIQVVCTIDEPRIIVFDNLLTAEECDFLISIAQEKLARGEVIDDETGGSIQHKHRTSDNASFTRGQHPILETIESRLEVLLNFPKENGEGLQVLRYGIGGEYRPHFDYFAQTKGGQKQMQIGGQRVGTCVMYLSDVEAGGGTAFPKISMTVRPKKGSAVFFADIDPYGKPDPKTLHAGLPVVRGVKFIATKWLRERAYQ